MASADIATQPTDRHSRRRPFTSWVKRLTNLKSSDGAGAKKSSNGNTKSKKAVNAKNNPYPQSGTLNQQGDADSINGHLSFSTPASRPQNGSLASIPASIEGRGTLADSNGSAAPTVTTNPDTVHSDAGYSKALTATTGGGALSTMDGVGGANSTFSSPNLSERSLATTLTTIQSTAATNALNPSGSLNQPSVPAQGASSLAPAQFSHQYPVSPTPASAIPQHLAPTGNPTTYSGATANNLLSDDASILTLASSSKRRRRRSMDTDASVRALAPSSVWGGSRESLPLSVLSGNIDHGTGPGLLVQGQRPSVGGLASAERASIYSSQGVSAPALASERNSFYAASQRQAYKDKDSRSIDGRSINRDAADGKSVNFDGKSLHGGESLKGYEGSIRSGALGHGRSDSIPGNGSPLASPGLARGLGMSRRNSDWNEKDDEHEHHGDEEDEEIVDVPTV